MNILITGGAGYIGTALCERLMREKGIDRIVIYDNLSRPNYNLFIGKTKLDKRFHFVQGDILDSRNLRKVVKDADIVFHLAAKVTTPFADENAHLFEQVNHWGTAELTYAIEESNVKKLVYLSSASVYGAGEEEKGVEITPNPKTFYGISKLRGEEHVRRLSKKTDCRIIRCANVYGYNRSMRFDAVINKFLFEANFHGKINVHGSGHQRRPFAYISTVADTLTNEIKTSDTPEIYDLVEDNFQVAEVVDALKKTFPEVEIIFINHNMKMRELSIHPGKSSHEANLERLAERLQQFKTEFTF